MCQRNLNNVTLEEYIEETGGLTELLYAIERLGHANGFNWNYQIDAMVREIEIRAKIFN